ncbi:MAG TPA: DnaJ domain-containing protein [Candidatus Limnocylindria bacterium]|nr:DnaJ domain-containing protein [Candidatus Limnocylindria bacterium]
MTLNRDAYEVLEVHPRAHQEVIQAAYRVLAGIYHPDRDQSDASNRRMAEVNAAYARLRTPDLRQLYDRERKLQRQSQPPIQQGYSAPQPPEEDPSKRPLDFGRYAGYTIAQVARSDPDYLRWLSRHSSGVRFRNEIEAQLKRIAQSREQREAP